MRMYRIMKVELVLLDQVSEYYLKGSSFIYTISYPAESLIQISDQIIRIFNSD
jgi:hypothetical protein